MIDNVNDMHYHRTKTAGQFLETLTKLINATDPSALMKTGDHHSTHHLYATAAMF